MRLTRGQHILSVDYEEDELGAGITLYWSSATQPKQVMEGFQMGPMLPAQGLRATFSCEQPRVCYTQKDGVLYAIALDYPDDQLVLDLDRPSPDMTVTLLGTGKTLPWHYEEGRLVIETGSLRYGDLRSTAAWVFKLNRSGVL